MQLLIATRNKHKLDEIRAIFLQPDLELVCALNYPNAPNVVEDGDTFEANAIKKAVTLAKATGLWSLADDSGLEVDALDGLPGLHSARFVAQPDATDADRRQALLEHLRGKPRPWLARFRCWVAVVTPDGETHLTEGVCQGEIVPEERGQNGFGYDPIFYLPELGKTMAELSMDEKNRLSHRARAVRAAMPLLRKF